jgi:hypothetical protein
MMGGGGGGGAPQLPPGFDWGDLFQKLLKLVLEADGPGGFQLQGPCDRDSEGDLLPPRVAEWGPSLGIERNIVKRIDALAELIQHHKDLRQPTCGGGGGRAVGQPVTVTFEEVEET